MWSDRICAGDEAARPLLSTYVDWLDRCAVSLTRNRFVQHSWTTTPGRMGGGLRDNKRGTYAPVFLLSCMIFSFHLRSSQVTGATNPVRLILRRALRCFPADVAATAMDCLDHAVLPGPTMLSRTRLFVDVAFMLLMVLRHLEMISEDGVLMGMLDSSPQGRRNWLNIQCTYVKGLLLHEIAVFIVEMCMLGNTENPDDDWPWRMEQLHDAIAENIVRHISFPCGLGSRHAGADHKAHAWLHSHRLESSNWPNVAKLIGLYFTICGDSGPELQINRIRAPAESLIPHWHTTEIQSGDGFDDIGDESLEHAGGFTMISTRHVVYIPGTYHIIELIEARLLDQFEDFPAVKPQIESACFVFHHKFSRDLFCEQLRGDRVLWRPMFDKRRPPPLFAGGRVWGVLVTISVWFRERRIMICAAWQQDHLMLLARGMGGSSEWLFK